MKVTCIQEHNGRFGLITVGEHDTKEPLVAKAFEEIPQIFEGPAKTAVKKAAKKATRKVETAEAVEEKETR